MGHACLMNERLHCNVIDAEVLLVTHQSMQVLIPKVVLVLFNIALPFVHHPHQFPVSLASFMTIKAQGQTFHQLGICCVCMVSSILLSQLRDRSFTDVHVEAPTNYR